MPEQLPRPLLPAYSGPASRCPKCGTVDAFTEYREHGICRHADGRDELIGEGVLFPRMHRECRCCGYLWDEAPLDDKGTTPTYAERQVEQLRIVRTQRETLTGPAA